MGSSPALGTDAPLPTHVVDRDGALLCERSKECQVSPGELPPLVCGLEHPEHTATHDYGHDENRAHQPSGGPVSVTDRVGHELRLARLDHTSREAGSERSPQP